MKRIISCCSVFAAATLLCLGNAESAFSCGIQRWNVKTAQDNHVKFFYKNNDISTGVLQPFFPTTILALTEKANPFPHPKANPPKSSYNLRLSKDENTMWTINAILTEKKDETDDDYHLILRDGDDTLVAEIPASDCLENTPEPFKSMIVKAREDFDEWFAKQTKKKFNQKVQITGLGFFDKIAHSTGEAPNGIELHPVIKIKFLK